ncbi:MAG: hypothetical protein COW88_02090 [Candidatus Lloydbacteria bacterium CG22_combo_CG10-13_8_21_14_all_47_15]|uniref:Uncharacterized protein n=1 Tax=Candidatus Lloydbacteria bacterium CG22_combo_CG10-13_8_21_14_all_47_15 TaxID=1974635 RepID=A0A2H0CU18_9BACT|nr:MAG: hypothetical protein COW88_02090 [Candidatus Lloydbacteria bacterium CG22_combo_CG10-13_8_21_14_all_47_15]
MLTLFIINLIVHIIMNQRYSLPTQASLAVSGVVIVAGILFFSALPAHADHGEETTADTNTRTYSSIRPLFKEDISTAPIPKTQAIDSAPAVDTGVRPTANTVRTRIQNAALSPEPTQARPADITDSARERTLDRKAEIETLRAEQKTRLAEERAKRITAYLERVFRRLDAALTRLEKLADRIQSRLTKLSERNIDISIAETLLATARKAIAEGRSALESVRAQGEALTTSDSPARDYAEMKILTRTAIDAVKKAHRALVEAIKSVKASDKTVGAPSDEQTTETE